MTIDAITHQDLSYCKFVGEFVEDLEMNTGDTRPYKAIVFKA